MTSPCADRWGVPVQAGDGSAVLLLDQAVEDQVALGGDPVGGAEAAIAADGELALAGVYRAYLSLYATTAEGVAEADALIKPLVDAAALLWRLSLYVTNVTIPATTLAADLHDLVDAPV